MTRSAPPSTRSVRWRWVKIVGGAVGPVATSTFAVVKYLSDRYPTMSASDWILAAAATASTAFGVWLLVDFFRDLYRRLVALEHAPAPPAPLTEAEVRKLVQESLPAPMTETRVREIIQNATQDLWAEYRRVLARLTDIEKKLPRS
jgi:hypothetical protein